MSANIENAAGKPVDINSGSRKGVWGAPVPKRGACGAFLGLFDLTSTKQSKQVSTYFHLSRVYLVDTSALAHRATPSLFM